MPETENATYSHGHHPSVLRSHAARTAQNSAAYLLPYLQPHMHILDVGCGPGTITTSLAQLVPEGHVTGVDYVAADADVLASARRHAAEAGVSNVTFAPGDVCNLEGIPAGTFDIVHCHQVLQHVTDPVQALREMKRVTKTGGIVAAREADAGTFAWFPETATMEAWMRVYRGVAKANGTEPDGGRRLVSWALGAGFDRGAVKATANVLCYSTPEERAWFGGMWADRTVNSTYATHAVDKGIADQETLERIAKSWREWTMKEDGWFALMHGEIVCRV